jgi:hypothetical protein
LERVSTNAGNEDAREPLGWLAELPYPWTQRDGLTGILRDPGLWADAFQSSAIRKSVKSAAKLALNRRGLAHNDSSEMSKLIVELLRMRVRRDVLFQELRRFDGGVDLMAAELHAALMRRSQKFLPETLHRRQGRRYYLSIEPYREWLQGADAASWEPRDLLAAIAPFAIVQPSDAPKLVRLLATRQDVEALLRADLEERRDATGPLKAVTADPRPRSEDPDPERAPPAAPDEQLDDRLDDRLGGVTAALRRAYEASQRAEAALAERDFARLVEESKAALEVSDAARAAYATLLAREDVPARTMPADIPKSALADGAGADAWLRELHELLQAGAEYRRAAVQRRRDSLAADFVRVGLPVPDELEAATTLEEIARLRVREAGRIRIEDAWQQLVQGSRAPFMALSGAERAGLAPRLADGKVRPKLVLRLFVDDETVRDACEVERLAPLAVELLLDDAELPDGLWGALRDRARDAFYGLLDAHALTELITEAPDARIKGRELDEVLTGLVRPEGHPLTVWYEERRVRRLPPAERVKAAAELALTTRAERWIRLLVEGLIDAERFAEAVLVGSVFVRTATTGQDVAALQRPFLRVLVDACQHPDRFPVLRSIVGAPGELISSVDGLVVLIYVASFVEPPQIETLMYRDPELHQAACDRYPMLVQEWLPRARDAAQRSARQARKARKTFSEWKHDLGKAGYSGWGWATDYQRRINEWLARRLEQLRVTRKPEDHDDPEDIIEALQQKHGLPDVDGGARRSLLTYLDAQLKRLVLLGELMAEIDDRDLRDLFADNEQTLHARLIQEAQSASGVIGAIYANAIREQTA